MDLSVIFLMYHKFQVTEEGLNWELAYIKCSNSTPYAMVSEKLGRFGVPKFATWVADLSWETSFLSQVL